MALDLKSVARNQFTSRTNQVIRSGLTKVAGNILGSALGSVSPANSPRLGFGGHGPFTPTMLNFPSDVGIDPAQGHYINFSIHKTTPAKVTAAEAVAKTGKMGKFSGELFGSRGSTGTGRSPQTGSGGDQSVIGLDFKKMSSITANPLVGRGGASSESFNKKNSIRLRRNSTKRVGGIISLYMPPNISVSYNANYTDEPIGAVADTAMQAFDEWTKTGDVGAVTRKALEGGTQAAKAAILGTINALAPGARALYALEKGQIITPRLELMFNNMGRREFSYSFVFIPRDQKESEIVEAIVKEFKSNMAADYKEEMGAIAGMRTMGIPNIFKIEYMYHGKLNTHLNTIGFCALRNVEVSYGSDRFVSYEGGYPQTTKLTLSFSEMDIITKTAIEQDGR
jgi:hypothetical protein